MDDIWLPNSFFGYSYPISDVYSRKNKLKTNILPPGLVLFDTFANLGSFYFNNNTSQTISGLNNEPKFVLMFGALNSGDNSIESKLNFNIGMATSSGNRTAKYMSSLDNAIYSRASLGNTITGFIKQNNFNTSANRFDQTFLAINPTGFHDDRLDMLVYNTGSINRNMNYLTFGGNNISAFITGFEFSNPVSYTKFKHGMSGLPTTILISANALTTNKEINFNTWLSYTFGALNFKRDQISIGLRSRGHITPNDTSTSSIDNKIFINNNGTSPISNNILMACDEEYIYIYGSGSNQQATIDIACIIGITCDIGQYKFNNNNETITISCDNKPEAILITSTPNSYNKNYIVNNNAHFNISAATQNKTISCGFIDIDNLSTSKVYNYQYDAFVEFNPSGDNSFSGDIVFNTNSISLSSVYLESGYGQGFYMIYSKPDIIPYMQEIYNESFENNISGDLQPSGNNYWTIVNSNASTGTYSLQVNCGLVPRIENAGVFLVKNLNNPGILYFDVKARNYGSTSIIGMSVLINNITSLILSRSTNPLLSDIYERYAIPLNSGENTIFFNHYQQDGLSSWEQGFIHIDNIIIKEIQTE